MLNKDTTLCISLAGRPSNIGTRFHNYLYEELGLNFVYKAFTTADIEGAIGGVRALGIRGCSVSMPFKEAVIPLVEELTASATAIDSVNTIVNDGGRLTAYNTDYEAVDRAHRPARARPGRAGAAARVRRDGQGGRGRVPRRGLRRPHRARAQRRRRAGAGGQVRLPLGAARSGARPTRSSST